MYSYHLADTSVPVYNMRRVRPQKDVGRGGFPRLSSAVPISAAQQELRDLSADITIQLGIFEAAVEVKPVERLEPRAAFDEAEDVDSMERVFAVAAGSSQDSKLFERRSGPTPDDALNDGRGHIVNFVELKHPQRAMRARRGDVRIRAVSIAYDEAP